MKFLSYLFSKSVSNFISPSSLYSITFPKGWRKVYAIISKPPPHSFFNKKKDILQISSFQNDSSNYFFDINSELATQKREYETTTILEIGSIKAINWNTSFEDSNSIDFHFIIGKGKVKLYITYILLEGATDDYVNNEFNDICNLILNIKINA